MPLIQYLTSHTTTHPPTSGTMMPLIQYLSKDKTHLFTIAGKNGVVMYEVDPTDRGKIVTSSEPVCSPVTAEQVRYDTDTIQILRHVTSSHATLRYGC